MTKLIIIRKLYHTQKHMSTKKYREVQIKSAQFRGGVYAENDSPQPQEDVATGLTTFRKLPPNSVT